MKQKSVLYSSVTGNKVYPNQPIKCRECNEYVDMLTHTHMRKHNLTQEEYCLNNLDQAHAFCWGDQLGYTSKKKFEKIREKAERCATMA